MPRIDPSHHYRHSGANADTRMNNTNLKTAGSSSTSTVAQLPQSDSISASRDEPLSKIPNTSNNLKTNWLTTTATPRFSRANLPHVVMPVRADSQKTRHRPTTAGNIDNDSANASLAVFRAGVIPDYKMKGKHVAAVEGSSISDNPEIATQNDNPLKQSSVERRYTTHERRKPFTSDTGHHADGEDRPVPLPRSTKSTNTFAKPHRSLSHDNRGDGAVRLAPEVGDEDVEQSSKKWQWSNIMKLFSAGTNKTRRAA